MQKHLGSSVENYIIAARTAQGYDDWKISTQSQRLDVVGRWHVAQVDLGKKKMSQQSPSHSPHGLVKVKVVNKAAQQEQGQSGWGGSSDLGLITASSNTEPSTQGHAVETTGAEFEMAIRQSVEVTSRGDPIEDQLIERAIRASLAELRLAAKEGDEDDGVTRAVQASIAEASRASFEGQSGAASGRQSDGGHQGQMEASSHSGMRGQQYPNGSSVHDPSDNIGPAWDDSGVDTDDDSNMKAALKESRQHGVSTSPKVDADLQIALEESRLHHHGVEKEKFEEEIVVEYVKRQSLAEDQHKQKLGTKGGETYHQNTEHDTDLRRSLEESLKINSRI